MTTPIIALVCVIVILSGIIIVQTVALTKAASDSKFNNLPYTDRLNCEKACKERLMSLIHSMFFFREFKDPKAIKNSLESSLDSARNGFDAEDEAMAKMYEEILNDIRPEWMDEDWPLPKTPR